MGQAIIKVLGKWEYDDFFMRNGLVQVYKDHVNELVVVSEAIEDEIISIAHRQGHLSAKKTQKYLQKSFHISNIATKVGRVVKNFFECMIMNAKAVKKEGLLSPIDKKR